MTTQPIWSKRTLALTASIIGSVVLLGAGCVTSPATPTNQTADNATAETDPTTLTIYAYDSLTADYGLLPPILENFETQENITVDLVSFADTGTMLNQLLLEQTNPQADVVMGLDNVNFAALQSETDGKTLLSPYQANRAAEIDSNLWFDNNYTMTPFDYGYIGFVYDTAELELPAAISLADLATDAYKDQLIIEQAGLSSPGTQFMLWAVAAMGEDGAKAYWADLAENVLTVAPDWSTAYYSLFLEGEAPVVLSYLTSPAYHIDQEATQQYQAVSITDGYIRQVEGIAVVAGTDNISGAQAFIDYILTDEVQNQIPTTQWIFPVLGDPETWPTAYDQIIQPTADQVLELDADELATNYPAWLTAWNEAFGIE